MSQPVKTTHDASMRSASSRFDLTYGYHVNATMYEYLLDNGMTREEYHWFRRSTIAVRAASWATTTTSPTRHLVTSTDSLTPVR